MRRGDPSGSLPKESVLKVDKDCHVSSRLEREYIRQSIAILRKNHLRVAWIKATRTRQGRHYYIKIDPPIDCYTIHRLQYLLGDDAKRVDYNRARINSGLVRWNKLFERPDARLKTVYRARNREPKSTQLST